MLDVKTDNLIELLSFNLAFKHATLNKAQDQDLDVHNLEKKVELWEHQVWYYKSSQGSIPILIDYAIEEHEANG